MSKYRYLTLEDRKQVERMHLNGERPSDIAAALGVHQSTVYKELRRGDTGKLDRNMRQGYSAKLAQLRVQENFRQRGRKPQGVG